MCQEKGSISLSKWHSLNDQIILLFLPVTWDIFQCMSRVGLY